MQEDILSFTQRMTKGGGDDGGGCGSININVTQPVYFLTGLAGYVIQPAPALTASFRST